jgi:hypothetical protein
MEGALDVVAIDDKRIARSGEYTAHCQWMMLPTAPRTSKKLQPQKLAASSKWET